MLWGFVDLEAGPGFAAQEWMEASQAVDAPVVVKMGELVGGEEFAAGALVVDGVASGDAFGVAGGLQSMVSLPNNLDTHSVADCSLPPRKRMLSQLPATVRSPCAWSSMRRWSVG